MRKSPSASFPLPMHNHSHLSPTNSVLSFAHLSYQVTTPSGVVKKLVDDVSVDIKAGELLAIMASPYMWCQFYVLKCDLALGT